MQKYRLTPIKNKSLAIPYFQEYFTLSLHILLLSNAYSSSLLHSQQHIEYSTHQETETWRTRNQRYARSTYDVCYL